MKVKSANQSVVVIAAGGTGGHVYPALSVAEYLLSQSSQVIWYGRTDGFEKDLLDRYPNIKYFTIGFSRRNLGAKAILKVVKIVHLCLAFSRSLYGLLNQRPNYIIIFGSYITFPVGLAAALLRIPIIIHEQNSVWGRANRMLAPFAKRKLCGFETQSQLPGQIVSGNPMRLTWQGPSQRSGVKSNKLNLLVIGGSQGAVAINQLMVDLLKQYPAITEAYTIHWQTGRHEIDIQDTESIKISCYIDPINEAYESAELLLARSGAMTVTEALFFDLPSIFLPYPKATDNHQYYNALAAQKINAEVMLMNTPCVKQLYLYLMEFYSRKQLQMPVGKAKENICFDKTLKHFIL